MTHYLWIYCTRAVCQGEPGVLHALRGTEVTAHHLSILYEDDPADPLMCFVVCPILPPALLVVEFIARCGTGLEEPAHLAKPIISSAGQLTS